MSGVEEATAKSGSVDGRLIFGSVLFGTGWGVTGLCPGPHIVGIGAAPAASGLWLGFAGIALGMWAGRLLERR